MQSEERRPYVLSAVLAALMAVQALLGLFLQQQYQYAEASAPAWLGNDLVTLVIAVPLLVIGLLLARRGSSRGLLLWLGAVAYSAFNYARYLFGTTLNAFFPLYILLLALSTIVLVLQWPQIDIRTVAAGFRAKTPVRVIGGGLALLGAGLGLVWLGIWATYAFVGWPTPIDTSAFRVVAALDIAVLMPLLVFGGVLLWMRRAGGYLVSAIAGVLASIYLLVLTVNSLLAYMLDIPVRLGEWYVWAPIFVATTAAAVVLLWDASPKTADASAKQRKPAPRRTGTAAHAASDD